MSPMPFDILLTLDIFRLRWDQPSGEVWLSVLPMIERSDLEGAIRALDTPTAFRFRMPRNEPNGDRLVCLPLPTGADLHFQIHSANGVRDAAVDRTNGMFIDLPGAFQTLNRPPSEFATNSGKDVAVPPARAAFAQSYNEALLALLDDREGGIDRVADQLAIGLMGGTTRQITPATVLRSDGAMMLVRTNPGEGVTNLHSLLGLMVKIGTKADLADLRTITRVTLELPTAGGPVVPTDLGDDPADDQFFSDYFSSLDPAPPAETITPTWNEDLASRLYALDHPTTTTPTLIDAVQYHQLRPDQTYAPRPDQMLLAPAAPRTVSRIELRAQQDGPRPVPGTDIEIAFATIVLCQLAPYRRYPATAGKNAVMRLSPARGHEEAFEKLLAKDPRAFFTAKLVGPDGLPLPSGALAPIGVFSFEWDSVPARDGTPAVRTVLFHGVPLGRNIEAVQVTAIVALESGGTIVRATAVAIDDRQDPRGPRWETTNLPVLDEDDFDSIMGTSGLPARVQPIVYYHDDFDFEFAQSASRIEGIVRVRYPQPQGSPSNADYLEDLVNHQALDIHASWNGEPPRHLNANSKIYAVHNEGHNGGAPLHLFHFRRAEKVDIRIDPASGLDPRQEVLDLYRKVGEPRPLTFDIEHRYGTTIDLAGLAPEPSTHADWRITLPQEATQRDTKDVEPPFSFLRVELDGNSRELLLHFDTRILDGRLAGPDYASTILSAWRSLGELLRADTIFVDGDLQRFDMVQGLGAHVEQGAMRSALVEIGRVSVNITQALQDFARDWLENAAGLSDPIHVDLGLGDISKLCNCAQFSLRVTRRPSIAPSQEDWDTVRANRAKAVSADQFGKEGLAVDTVTPSAERISEFLKPLTQVSKPLPLTDAAMKDAEIFRSITGMTESWIVPKHPIDAPSDAVAATLVPLSFRPIKPNPAIGWDTEGTLQRFSEAIEVAVDVQSTHWAASRDVFAWQNHFATLEANHDAVLAVITAPCALLHPLPDPNALASGTAAVKQTITEAKDPAHPLFAKAAAWRSKKLLAQPSLFASSKAILLSHLRKSGTRFPEDLFQLQTTKLLSDPQKDVREDRDIMPFTDASLAGDTVTFFEVLDDISYANNFGVTDFTMPTFESAISLAAMKHSNARPFVAPRNEVELKSLLGPTGALLGGTANEPRISLAARDPVKDPIFLDSRLLAEGESDPMAGMSVPVSLEALRRAEIAPAKPGEGAARLIARSGPWTPSAAVDSFAACAVFSIRGNEETDLFDSLQTDAFYVSLEAIAPITLGAAALASPTSVSLPEFFAALRAAPDLRSFPELDRVIDRGVLSFAENLFAPADPFTLPPAAGQSIVLERRNGVLGLKIGSGSKLRAAYLFQVQQPGGGADEALGLFLMVGLEAPIWQQYRANILQTRNDGGEAGEAFDPVFVQGSRKVSSNAVLAATRARNLLGTAPKRYTSRRIGAATLVDQLVGSELSAGTTAWKNADLSITISHQQASSAPSGHLLAHDDFGEVGFSSFPLRNYRFEKGEIDDVAKIEFDAPFEDFLVDFQWSSTQNLQFLRLFQRRVTIV